MYGGFTSNVDMKTGAPAFGTPDYVRATQITGQMARYYGLPLRSSNTCAANAPDPMARSDMAASRGRMAGGIHVAGANIIDALTLPRFST